MFYIIMEYMDNGSLRGRLRPDGLPLNTIIPIIGQTCDALFYAHKMGVIHRDVKPENIMFSSRGVVKLVDFGIAKLTSAPTITREGWLIGTPYYMSYEQSKGQEVTPQSDIYSLGVVLYEMLTGRVPFTGGALTIIYKHIHERPIPPRSINPHIPPYMERAVLRALEKDPSKRFQTAEEMARAIGYTLPMSPPLPYTPRR
jgi:serine/threonine-protein kinase